MRNLQASPSPSGRGCREATGEGLLLCAIFALLVLLAACGKVGDPLPPFIRIPEPVKDLSATQRGYDIVLVWTNPLRNIDGSAATGLLDHVHIRSGDAVLVTVNVSGAGEAQSYSIPSRPDAGIQRTFTLQVETTEKKLSEASNPVSITPAEIPGAVTTGTSAVDQRRIVIEWEAPEENAQYADVYIVSRSDRPENDVVAVPRFEDPRYVHGQIYTYQVTAARRTEQGLILGLPGRSLTVAAFDNTAPAIPQGLQAVAEGDGGFLTWQANSENDLAGYRVFRSDGPGGLFSPINEGRHAPNAIFDPDYRPGLYYTVSAVDEFGNESARDVPYRAP